MIADKNYDLNTLIEQREKRNCKPIIIPPRLNRKTPRKHDKHVYKERHLIECFFNKINHFRMGFSRFDKKACTYMGFPAFASVIIWLRSLGAQNLVNSRANSESQPVSFIAFSFLTKRTRQRFVKSATFAFTNCTFFSSSERENVHGLSPKFR